MSYIANALIVVLDLVFGFFILLVLLRFLFQLARASFYNPLAQFIVTFTNPLLKPLRRIVPGFFGIDFASVVLLLALQIAEIYLVGTQTGIPSVFGWTSSGAAPAFLGVLVLAIAMLIQLTLWIYLIAIFVRVILSWFTPYGARTPAGDLLYGLTEPLMYPARRMVRPINGLDLSPMLVILLLYVSLHLIVSPLMALGTQLSYSRFI
jgi:YggT family protein